MYHGDPGSAKWSRESRGRAWTVPVPKRAWQELATRLPMSMRWDPRNWKTMTLFPAWPWAGSFATPCLSFPTTL